MILASFSNVFGQVLCIINESVLWSGPNKGLYPIAPEKLTFSNEESKKFSVVSPEVSSEEDIIPSKRGAL